MEGLSESEVDIVEREELMVSPSGDGEPTMRVAHFLQPTVTSIDGLVFELPAHCLSCIPQTFEPKYWPLKLTFNGCLVPREDWKIWVGKMASLHESTWKKAGIHEAILNSTYSIQKHQDLVIGLAEKWSPETKSFIFSWGEATITLEDMMISGYSVLGSSVFSPIETDELERTAEKLNQAITELSRTSSRKANHCMWKKKFMDSGSEIEHEAFLAFWLSRFVFPDSSVIVRTIFPIAIHLARGTRIALAPAVLASIYRDLSLLKEKIVALAKLDNSCEDEEEDSALAFIIRSPLQLVKIWAWERFPELRPKPNLIKLGEPRFAQWHKTMIRVENVRRVLDSARESFDWRPYAKTLKNWKFPKFYTEKEMWVSVDDPDHCEELESFARCLRISELVGRGCVEHYLPHRVAMQFGLDQDLPACIAQVNDYSKPISYANLYVPLRLYEADVTTRYLEWWKESLLRLQGASEGVLLQERTFMSSNITQKKRSKTAKRVNHFEEGVMFSSYKIKTIKLVETSTEREEDVSDASASAGLSTKTLPLSLIVKKELNDSPFPPGFPPKNNLAEAGDTTKEDNQTIAKLLISSKRHDDIGNEQLNDSPFPPGFPPKNNLVEAGDTTKEDNLTIAKLLISSKRHDDIGNEQLNDSPFPPGFPPKSNPVDLRDKTKEDNLITTGLSISSKRHDDIGNGQLGDGEYSSRHCQKFSSSKVVNEADNIFTPLTELIEKIKRNELVKSRLETAMEDATGSKTGSPSHDMERSLGAEGVGNEHATEIQGLQLEDRVSRLERIFAKLKAARFGHK
ncbi:hypothetical protein ACOSQ4_030835 [Xanthoceras sorbifolium]